MVTMAMLTNRDVIDPKNAFGKEADSSGEAKKESTSAVSTGKIGKTSTGLPSSTSTGLPGSTSTGLPGFRMLEELPEGLRFLLNTPQIGLNDAKV